MFKPVSKAAEDKLQSIFGQKLVKLVLEKLNTGNNLNINTDWNEISQKKLNLTFKDVMNIMYDRDPISPSSYKDTKDFMEESKRQYPNLWAEDFSDRSYNLTDFKDLIDAITNEINRMRELHGNPIANPGPFGGIQTPLKTGGSD